MKITAEERRETAKEFRTWVEEHKPSPLITTLIVAYFAFAGIFPYGGAPLASLPIPAVIVAVGSATSLHYGK